MSTQQLTEQPREVAEPTLANYWHPIGMAGDVTDQPRRFTLLGRHLVAFRDGQGPVIMEDLCIHRGAALSLGSVTDGQITCAYHGWRYDRTGACTLIPSLPPGSTIPRKARAFPYPAVERYGLVWTVLGEPAADIPAWPDDAWDSPEFRNSVVIGGAEWQTSAGRSCENDIDISHVNFLHHGLIDWAEGPVVKDLNVTPTDFGLTFATQDLDVRYEYEVHLPFTVFMKKYSVAEQAVEDGDARKHAWQALSAPKDGVTSQGIFRTPIDGSRTRTYFLAARNHTLDIPDDEWSAILKDVFEQDRVMVESQRPERIPTNLREELHLKVPDAVAIEYRRGLARIAPADPIAALA